MIRWHDGKGGSSRDALAAVAARAFLLGVLLGFARGLLAHREPRETGPAPHPPSRDLRPWDDAPVEQTIEAAVATVGRMR